MGGCARPRTASPISRFRSSRSRTSRQRARSPAWMTSGTKLHLRRLGHEQQYLRAWPGAPGHGRRQERVISFMSTESDDAARLKLLLADIRDAFAKEGEAPVANMFAEKVNVEIASADLVKELIAIEGRPWAAMGRRYRRAKPLTQVKLAHMLKPLAIVTGHIGSEARVRGYKLWQFEEAFSRYLPPERSLSSRRVQDLAEWYSHQAYWNYSKNALDVGALDADLRAILRKEVSPWHVETEAERVVTASRFASPSERGRY